MISRQHDTLPVSPFLQHRRLWVAVAIGLGVIVGLVLDSATLTVQAQNRRSLQMIENQVLQEAKERQELNRDRLEHPVSPQPASQSGTPTVSPAPAHLAPGIEGDHLPPDKVFFSWLGGNIKLHRRRGQVYLTLFKS